MNLKGSCNQCGKCCQLERDGRVYSCANLVQIGSKTACAVYDFRYSGMPIRMVLAEGPNAGSESFPEVCVPEFPLEGNTLPEGCGYKL